MGWLSLILTLTHAVVAGTATDDVVALCERLVSADDYVLVGVQDAEAFAALSAEAHKRSMAPIYIVRIPSEEDPAAFLTRQLSEYGMRCGLVATPASGGWSVEQIGTCTQTPSQASDDAEPDVDASPSSGHPGRTYRSSSAGSPGSSRGSSGVASSGPTSNLGLEPVSFHTLKFDISQGAKIGEVMTARDFRPAEIHWGSDYSASGWNVAGEAVEVLSRAGLTVSGGNELFGSSRSEPARYVIGGLVKGLDYRSWAVGGPAISFHESSSCSVRIEWQLFDARSEQVVHSYTTRGKKEHDNLLSLEAACRSAVRASLGSFASLSSTRHALKPPPEPQAVTWNEAMSIPACQPTESLSLPDQLDDVMGAVLLVSTDDGDGSGVLISAEGHALTAAHVVDDASSVDVQLHAGMTLPAAVLRVDQHHDVALLKLQGAGYTCIAVADDDPGLGTELFAIGSPAGSALSFSVSRGIVSAHREWEDKRFIQTDASLNPGNSGGPLLDERGRLVAIVSFKLAGLTVEGLGFGVPTDVALDGLGLTTGE